jgi:hypothetical protein
MAIAGMADVVLQDLKTSAMTFGLVTVVSPDTMMMTPYLITQ